MSDPITENSTRRPTEGRRRAGLLWAGGVIAAAILLLAVNGTLSSWTSAVIDNSQNDVASTDAVTLVESDGTHTCTTAPEPTNEVTCSSINKYGGTAVPLVPGSGTQVTSVKLHNTGSVAGNLVLTADACGSKVAGAATAVDPVTYPLCNVVTVALSCTTPSVLSTSAVPLSSFTTETIGTLAADQSTDCTFTLNLPVSTPSGYASQVASQVLHWTLTAS